MYFSVHKTFSCELNIHHAIICMNPACCTNYTLMFLHYVFISCVNFKTNLSISGVLLAVSYWIQEKLSAFDQHILNSAAPTEQFVSQVEFTWP
jgi:hypothetical protein